MTPDAQPQALEVTTSLGTIPVCGVFDDRPRILCITGMFSTVDEMGDFGASLEPGYAGLVAKLPGHGGPSLGETSIAAFARAFDELAEQLDIRLVVGISAGGLVALSMASPRVRAAVVADPPLETAKLWMMAGLLEQTFPEHEAFHRNVVGFAPGAFVGRCYLDLLDDLRRPTWFVVGDNPLFPARVVTVTPSVVDEPTRRLIRREPLARLRLAPQAGHFIRRDGRPTLFGTVREACDEVFPAA